MSVDFIVLGLPRSGTTWIANWLTTDRSLCLHDPFNQLPENWPRDERLFGVSCTGAYLLPRWLDAQNCAVAVIERDPEACEASLAAAGLPGLGGLPAAISSADGRRWRFSDLWKEDAASELWAFLLPGIPFDALRYRLLRDMRIEPKEYGADMDVAAELFRRYRQGVSVCRGEQ